MVAVLLIWLKILIRLTTFNWHYRSKLLVAGLTIIGTAVILLWMHWQLGLFIMLLESRGDLFYAGGRLSR